MKLTTGYKKPIDSDGSVLLAGGGHKTIQLIINDYGALSITPAVSFSNPISGNLLGNASTADRLKNPVTINGVNFDGSGNITINASASDTNLVKVYTRAQIGTSPNYDNPGVNGLFEIRLTEEVTGETGTKPINGYYPILSLKAEHVMLQIAGSNGNGFYIRGRQSGNVTLADVNWLKLLDSSNYSSYAVALTGNQTVGGIKTFNASSLYIKNEANGIHLNIIELKGGSFNTSNRGGLIDLYAITANSTANSAGTKELKLELSADGEGGNIRIYSPTDNNNANKYYYTNASGSKSPNIWEFDSYDGNLRIVTKDLNGTATKASNWIFPLILKRDGKIYGNLVGNVTGNVSGSSGSCTGRAASATDLLVREHASNNTVYYPMWANGTDSNNGSGTVRNIYITKDKYQFIPSSGRLSALQLSVGITSGSRCCLLYDSTNKCVNFVFD